MDKLFNFFSMLAGGVGGFLVYVFGGFDNLLKTLLILIIIDYITGVLKALYNKELSSAVGSRGIIKKVIILLVVAATVVVQKSFADTLPVREVVIVFYISNECLSVFENASQIIPFPEPIKEFLLQIKNDTLNRKIKKDDANEKN